MQLYDKTFFTLAYPSICLYVLCAFSPFAMIINLLM